MFCKLHLLPVFLSFLHTLNNFSFCPCHVKILAMLGKQQQWQCTRALGTDFNKSAQLYFTGKLTVVKVKGVSSLG